MIIILLVCLFLIAIGVGGYFVYQGMQKQKTEDLENQFSKTPGLHLFPECDYKGTVLQSTENLPESAEDEHVRSMESGFYSFILTDGYKIDTYNKPNLAGTKISYVGPQNTKCLKTPIKSLKFYKFEESEESD
jgi:hypothetical protein